MQFHLKTQAELMAATIDCLVIPVFESKTLSGATKAVNEQSGGGLRKILHMDDIKGKTGQTLLIPHLNGLQARRVLLVGCGQHKKCAPEDFHKIVSSVMTALKNTNSNHAALLLDDIQVAGHDTDWVIRQLALLAKTAVYQYDTTKSAANKKPVPLHKISVAVKNPGHKPHLRAAQEGLAIGEGINTARQLGNLPANICTPNYLAGEARKLARQYEHLHAKVLNEKQMADLGMGAFLSVTAGSAQPACLILLEYKGSRAAEKPYVLVGKGITFDSGGISLKPGAAMDEMKFDMGGAAAVLGTMSTAARLKLPINLVGIITGAENMPSGQATKPGDIVTSLSGKTIEILNTDAEGRLLLCDALTYAARYKPAVIIDIATLTGACVVALGNLTTGLFANNDTLAKQLLQAGDTMLDKAWQLPIWKEYHEQLKSNFADLPNIGSGPGAGSISAACFLSKFVEDQQWAHLDIAGTAWQTGPKKGATGRPVALLSQYLLDRCRAPKSLA